MTKFNLKDQLAGIAALIAAIVAIGGGFVKYGEIMTKLDVLSEQTGPDLTPLAQQMGNNQKMISDNVGEISNNDKDIAKNLALKNIIKIKAMTSEQVSLDLYANAVFYKPKDIYLEQLNIFDNRQIYVNVSLTSYIKTDKVAIKANALHEINLKKQRLLIELEQLKNGKI